MRPFPDPSFAESFDQYAARAGATTREARNVAKRHWHDVLTALWDDWKKRATPPELVIT